MNAMMFGMAENSIIGSAMGIEDTWNWNLERMYAAMLDGDAEAAAEYRKHILAYNSLKKDGSRKGDKELNSSIKSRIKEGYLAGDMTAEEAQLMLIDYADMDPDDAEDYVDKLRYTTENEGAEYGDLKEDYLSGELTAEEAQAAQTEYGGVKDETAAANTAKWDYEKETGIAYTDMKDAYLKGEISAKEAVDARVKYGGQERDDAYFDVTGWDYEKSTGREWHGRFTKVHDGISAGDLTATRKAIDEIYQYGGYEDSAKAYSAVSGSITNYYKPLYIAATPAERTKMENRLIEAYRYNYEKAGDTYHVTYGNRSLTEPEVYASAENQTVISLEEGEA